MKQDLTKGNIFSLIISFAIPLFVSNLFQQIYNLADTTIVGHILGDQALAAVGSVSSIYNLLLSLCIGISSGCSILVAQAFGSGNDEQMKRNIAAALELILGVTAFLTLMGCLFMKPFMRLLKISDSLFDQAYSYIIIITAGLLITAAYNAISGILRALGNTVIPLVFLIISSLLNIGLDLLFISRFSMGIRGAAYATLLAQLVSVILCALYVLRFCPQILPQRRHITLDAGLLKRMFTMGMSMALMYAIVNVGSVILQMGINGLGDNIIAAHVAARKITELCMMPVSTLSATMTTFTGQNFGAGRMDRIRTGTRLAILMGFVWSTLLIIIMWIGSRFFIYGVTGSHNPAILDWGSRYLRINTPFYYALVVLCVIRNVLQGISKQWITVVASLLEMLGKLVAILFFVGPFGYLAICFCEPVTWIICCVPVLLVLVHTLYTNTSKREA